MKTSGFPRQARITKTDDFSSVFSLRKRLTGHFLAIHYAHATGGEARIGLVVGKKTARRAVSRNYMKRVLRELFRKTRCALPAFELVVRAQKPFSDTDYAVVEQEFAALLARLPRPKPQADA
ncbi:ribonuclease P protein component [Methylobacillus flagellatus]|uniref:ribonuclease P protein component n=1 Tax=Methylobacillus flagellatus TaxID=405 RepID=UPI0010F5D42D|nr:ribonuclease P protein component [Methylobacillus flagellatus]